MKKVGCFDINLSLYRRDQCSQNLKKAIWLLPLALLAVMGGLWGYKYYVLAEQRSIIRQYRQEIGGQGSSLSSPEGYAALKERVEQRRRDVNRVRQTRTDWAPLLETLDHSLPEGTKITSIRIKAGRVRVIGYSPDYPSLSLLGKSMLKSGLLTDMRYVYARQKAEAVEFELEFEPTAEGGKRS